MDCMLTTPPDQVLVCLYAIIDDRGPKAKQSIGDKYVYGNNPALFTSDMQKCNTIVSLINCSISDRKTALEILNVCLTQTKVMIFFHHILWQKCNK